MTTRMRWCGLALALVLAAACAGDDDSDAQATSDADTITAGDSTTPEFVAGTCPSPIPIADGFRCGTVPVPVRRGGADSPTIDVAVAVLPAPERGRHDDPVLVVNRLNPSLAGYDGFSGLPEALGRDVVLFDMRGLGGSKPSLECTEVDYLVRDADTDPAVRQGYLDALDACHERLMADDIDLTAYTVDAIAADIVDIRRALGYDTWNVMGYGQNAPDPGASASDIVFELMRRDSAAIRSVSLESPTPSQQDPWSIHIENLALGLDVAVAACAHQPGCAAVEPGLRDRLTESFRQPRVEYPATSGEGDPMTVVLDPAWAGYYDSFGLGDISFLPSFASAVALPPEELVKIVGASTNRPVTENAFVHGFQLSVLCPHTGADSAPADRSTPNDFSAVSWGLLVERDSCERWTFADPEPRLDEPVTSDIPTLLLVGQFDPFNTAAGARLVASTLSSSHVFEIPAATANPLGHSECAREIRNSFVDDPSGTPDTSCLATVPPLAFTG